MEMEFLSYAKATTGGPNEEREPEPEPEQGVRDGWAGLKLWQVP